MDKCKLYLLAVTPTKHNFKEKGRKDFFSIFLSAPKILHGFSYKQYWHPQKKSPGFEVVFVLFCIGLVCHHQHHPHQHHEHLTFLLFTLCSRHNKKVFDNSISLLFSSLLFSSLLSSPSPLFYFPPSSPLSPTRARIHLQFRK